MRGLLTGRHKSWQVLSIALAFCLKRVIISKDWIAVANRLVPVLGTGNYDTSKIPPVGGRKCLKWRNTNTPTQTVQTDFYTFLQFYTVLYSLVDQVCK